MPLSTTRSTCLLPLRPVPLPVGDTGWELPASQGNFVYFPLGERSGEFAEFADARGLVLRAYGTDGVRATIAEPEANDRLVDVVKGFVGTR